MSAPEVTDTLAAAIEFRDRGWRPFPLDHPAARGRALDKDGNPTGCTGAHPTPDRPDKGIPCDGQRGKHPIGGWATQAATVQHDKMLTLWFNGEPRNVGIATKPSGLFVVDEDIDGALCTLADELGETLPITYRVRTSRGWHWYFQAPAGIALRGHSPVLKARGMDVRGNRGEGGYVVAAGSVHESGHVYVAEDPHVVPAEIPGWLLAQILAGTDGTDGSAAGVGGWEDEPRYGTAVDLHAQYQRHLNAVRSPGFRYSLFLAALDAWRLVNLGLLTMEQMREDLGAVVARVWAAPPDEADKCIVNDEARVKALSSPWALIGEPGGTKLKSAKSLDNDSDQEGDQEGDSDERSTWAPVDLSEILAGNFKPTPPEIMRRSDGPSLLYPGKVHSFHGESESGKSWLALIAAVEVLGDDGQVLFIDHESDAETVCERLVLLGAKPDAILKRFTYVAPDQPLHATDFPALLAEPLRLTVIDGVTDAISTEGCKSNDQDDVSLWLRRVPKRIARETGAAVVLIDHVTKSKDGRGRFALGSQQKMNGLTGAAYTVDIGTPFGRGMIGEVVMRVGKDRPGQVRPNAGKPSQLDRTAEVARVTIDSRLPGRILTAVNSWKEEDLSLADVFDLPTVDDWNSAEQAPLPDDIAGYRGNGQKAIRDLARFVRAHGQGGIGVDLTGARAALKDLKVGGKPKHDRETVGRAWGALFDMGRIEPAESNASANPRGLHHWVKRPNDPS